MSKLNFTLVALLQKKVDAIFEKLERVWHFSSHDIAEELKIDHKIVFGAFKKDRYAKARYLDAS